MSSSEILSTVIRQHSEHLLAEQRADPLPHGEGQRSRYGEECAWLERRVAGVKKKGVQKAPLAPYTFRNKMPPLKSILPWVKLKKVRLRDKKGKFKKGNYRSIAFMVQRSVFAQGIRPTMFFTKPFAKAFKNLPEELVESFGLDLKDFFDFTKK